jgi:hypothetical protein
LATDAQIDLGAVPEPGAQTLGGGERRPYALGRMGQLERAFDPIRERHIHLLTATIRLR